MSLLRNLVDKLQREVEGLKSDHEGALTSQREAEDARETLAAALARANARIAELTSKAAQLTRARSALAAQVRSLEEQAQAATAAAATTAAAAATAAAAQQMPNSSFNNTTNSSFNNTTESLSSVNNSLNNSLGAADLAQVREDNSEASLPLIDRAASVGGDNPMRQRQRHRHSGGGNSVDLEDGGARLGTATGAADPGHEGYGNEDNTQAKPGDHVKSLLIACASNPVWSVVTGRFPWIVTWLQQQPPQALWSAAMAYLGLVHLLVLYKTVTC